MDLMQEGVPAALPIVGAVTKAHRSLFRQERFTVIDAAGSRVSGIWDDGEVATIRQFRIRKTISPASDAIRSTSARLLDLLQNEQVAHTDECQASLVAHWNQVREDPANAIGLLLDHEHIGLSLNDALTLPIAPWRVRYEYLCRATDDSPARERLATSITQDNDAPRGIRIRVAVAEGIDPHLIDPQVSRLLSTLDASATDSSSVAADLIAVGFTEASALQAVAESIANAATDSKLAAALVRLENPAEAAGEPIYAAGLPHSLVDDLISAGCRAVNFSAIDPTEHLDGHTEIPYLTYLRGRLAPSQLQSSEVVTLAFESEAYRRYLTGDDDVVDALPPAQLDDAKAARALKRGNLPDGPVHGSVLAEAVQAIKPESSNDPAAALLKDRSLWPTLIQHGVIFDGANSSTASTYHDLASLRIARVALFEWNWSKAVTVARARLRGAKRESVRDELLNIIACALWLKGEHESALAALDSALEGDYSDALLANAAVVASELESAEAVDRFVRLAREAPNTEQRAMAAERALVFWNKRDLPAWEESTSDIPAEILEALRPLIAEQIEDERYRRILGVLAESDSDWLGRQPDSAFGQNYRKSAARVYRARAKDFLKYIRVLRDELKVAVHEEWLDHERDALVDSAIQVLLEDSSALAAAAFGVQLIEDVLPMSDTQWVKLACLTVSAIVGQVDPEQGEPQEKFIGWVAKAQRIAKSAEGSDQEFLDVLVSAAGNMLGQCFVLSRSQVVNMAMTACERIKLALAVIPTFQVNRNGVDETMKPIAELCSETLGVLNKVWPIVRDRQLLAQVNNLIESTKRIQANVQGIRRKYGA